MFEYDHKKALGVVLEAEQAIKAQLHRFPDDDIWGGPFNAECLWMRETYARLLTFWPGRKYALHERPRLLAEFNHLLPGCPASDCALVPGNLLILGHRNWLVFHEHQDVDTGVTASHLVMGYTDCLNVGWPCVDEDGIISPEAILILDALSGYMWAGNRLEEMGRLLEVEDSLRNRHSSL